MPNRNYKKGAKKERGIVNKARSGGLLAFRSAGSHSEIDVFILNIFKKEIYLIQSKPNNWGERRKAKLRNSLKYLEGTYRVIVDVQ